MKKTVKCLISLLITLALVASLAPAALADEGDDRIAQGGEDSQTLYDMGLLKGAGTLPDGSPDFQLTRTTSRGEAITMLVRIAGGEPEALCVSYDHTFIDAPDWADPYIGYAYYYNITKGVDDAQTRFGTDTKIDLNIFLTFVLRALGYEAETDWRDPYPVADSIGLYYPRTGDFVRADLASICLSALDVPMKNGGTLRSVLTSGGMIGPGAGSQYKGSFKPGPAQPLVNEIRVTDDGLIRDLTAAIGGHAETIKINCKGYSVNSVMDVIGDLIQSGYDPFSDAYGYSAKWSSSILNYSPNYSDAAHVMAALEGRETWTRSTAALSNRAKNILYNITTPAASDYDKVKAIHDYVINHTAYGELEGMTANNAAGPLFYGTGVCQGYTYTMDLMCYLTGIECLCVSGQGNGGSHAWNKVKVDGKWYNIDLTWDDPVTTTGEPVLRWDYFLVSDDQLAKDHVWQIFDFIPACPANYPG